MKMIIIYQGDQFPITFSIEGEDGNPVTSSDIVEMIFTVGDKIWKSYTDGDITYDSEKENFTIWLGSDDTSDLLILPYQSQLRVFFTNNNILSFDCGQLLVKECLDNLSNDNQG